LKPLSGRVQVKGFRHFSPTSPGLALSAMEEPPFAPKDGEGIRPAEELANADAEHLAGNAEAGVLAEAAFPGRWAMMRVGTT
jgi:hypothetical protein